MASLNSELASPCVNIKEANEIPVEASYAEFNSAKLEPVACMINPKMGEHAPHHNVHQQQDKKTYECEECVKIFPTVRTFREHLKCHIKLFTCWICDKTFSVMAQLTSHLTNCNKQQKSMYCNICDKKFDFPALFKQHKLIYHPEDRPCCEAFQKRHVFVQNMQKTPTKGNLYTCPVCQKGFPSTFALRQHSLLHEVNNFFCVVCHKEFTTTKIDFKIHVQQHIPENQPPFKCERCPKFFGKKKRLMSHYRVEHPLKRVIVTNETVSSVGVVASKKKTAILSESDIPFTITDKEFCEISDLTMKTNTRRFTCPVCQKVCQSRYSLLEHSYVHEVNNFICVVCHKEFTTSKSVFKIHMQQHCTRDKRGLFTCEHCPRYYAHKNGLISHYRVEHPPTKVVSDKEFCENSELTDRVTLVESEANEKDSVKDKKDNILLESEEAASGREFSEENEKAELLSFIKSEPSSPRSPYANLEDDKFTIEETDVKTEESNVEVNNPSLAIIGSKPDTVNNNDPRLVDVDQKLHEKSYECHECHQNYINASYLRQHFMKSHCKLLCWICGESFLKVDQLASHMANHKRIYTCKLCNKSFLHLSDYETHITQCSQNHMANGNKLFSCGICGKRFITKGHLETHLKTHTEDKLLARPSKRVVTNETESSIAAVTRRKVKKKKVEEHKDHVILPESDPDGRNVKKKKVEEHKDVMYHVILPESDPDGRNVKKKKVEEHKDVMYHVILPESDPDGNGLSIATAAHEKVKQKNLEDQEDFLLPESDPLDCNGHINDKDICERSELTKLIVYSVKSEPSSP